MNHSVIKAFAACAIGAAFLTSAHVYSQQRTAGLPGNYPSKPVRVIIAAGVGGLPDITGRIVIAKLAERWGAHFVLDNRAGANVAFDLVSRAAPDGYTLLVSTTSLFFAA